MKAPPDFNERRNTVKRVGGSGMTLSAPTTALMPALIGAPTRRTVDALIRNNFFHKVTEIHWHGL
jgi:hypothetical protein